MADLEKTVAIIFEGVDQMGTGVDSATRQIDSVAGSVQSATQPMADFTKDVFAFEAALLAAGVAVTGFSIKLAGDFDSQFREISTLIDAPTESLAGFRQEILGYSTDSSQSLDSITSAIYNAISGGADYVESLELVQIAEKAAVAGKADLDASLKTIQSSLNAYGRGMDDAEHFTDLLFTTVKSGVTTFPELGGSLANVTGLAASAGVSFEELLAAIATLTATGSTTSGAVTQIQNAISNILKPTSQARDLAEELGIEFNAAAIGSKGLEGVLLDVQEATGGNVEQMAQLFGSTQALNGVLTLTGLGAEKFAENLEKNRQAAGALEEAHARMAGQISEGTQRIQNAMKGALIAVGDPLLDEFTGIQEAIAAIFNAIGVSVSGGQLKAFVDELEGVFQSMEAAMLEVAANLPEALEKADFSAFMNGIDLVKEAISDLFDGADITSVDGLVTVIETLGLAFETLSAYTAGAITAIAPFIEQVAKLANWFLEINPVIIATVGAAGGLAIAVNTVLGVILKLNEGLALMAGTRGVLPKVAPLFRGVVAALTGPVGITVAVAASLPFLEKLVAGFLNVETRAERLERIRLSPGGEEAQRWREYQAAIDGVSLEEYLQISEDMGYADDRMRKSVAESIEVVNGFKESLRGVSEPAHNWGNALDIVNVSTGETVEQTRALAAETLGLALETDKVSQALADARGQDPWSTLRDQYLDYRDAFARGEIDAKEWAAIQEDYQTKLAEATGQAAKSQKELAGEVLKGEDAILKARQAILDYEVELESLASNERIKTIEFQANIQIAEIEADVRKVEAVFGALNNTIDSTGQTLSSLYDTLGSGDLSRFQQLDLEKILKQENEDRRKAMELERELTRAQIEQMKAKTEALRSGDGLIKIDSTGLEPALEMIMWEILEKVQLRANAEGAEFLLGIGG